jgi:phosphatidate cytidylyltransferase
MSAERSEGVVTNATVLAGPGRMADLGVRLLSGTAFAAIAVGLLYAGVWPFAALMLVVTLLMCWEWGHIVRSPGFDTVLGVHAATVVVAVILAALGFAAPALIALIAGTCIVIGLRFGEKARLSAIGVLYVGLPAVALIALRSSEPYGFPAVLFVVLAVAATDTFAYFVGRSVGGPKLWPSISPKKTWSGLIGGICGAALIGVAFGMAINGGSSLRLAVIGLTLGLISQAGDLAESALKREFHVKDASHLIPGHGGFMDRLDGMVVAAVAAMLIGLGGSIYVPARALLLGF